MATMESYSTPNTAECLIILQNAQWAKGANETVLHKQRESSVLQKTSIRIISGVAKGRMGLFQMIAKVVLEIPVISRKVG